MATKFKKKNALKRSYKKNEGVLKVNVISHFVRKISIVNTFRAISEKLQLNKL